MNVLLVEEDFLLAAKIRQALQEVQYETEWVRCEEEARRSISVGKHDAILLDSINPIRRCQSLIQFFRAADESRPVIVFSEKHDLDGIVSGLDAGADDCIVKPFATCELLARLHAVKRRMRTASDIGTAFNQLTVNVGERLATLGDAKYRLTYSEFNLLRALLMSPGRAVSRGDLEVAVHAVARHKDHSSVDVLIHGLRGKLGSHVIRNVRGVGWLVDLQIRLTASRPLYAQQVQRARESASTK